jgi:hypothetical protein
MLPQQANGYQEWASAGMAAPIAARISNTIRIGGTLIRRSLLLHEFREPIEVL